MIQKTNKNIPRGNKYILENILLNMFKFYVLKYFIKFLQMIIIKFLVIIIIKKKFGFHNFAKHRLRTNGLPTGIMESLFFNSLSA